MLRRVFIQECDLSEILLHPRFAVVTEKADGSMKVAVYISHHACRFVLDGQVRAVDHFSWSAFGEHKEGSVNGHVAPAEKLRHDTLDSFAEALC